MKLLARLASYFVEAIPEECTWAIVLIASSSLPTTLRIMFIFHYYSTLTISFSPPRYCVLIDYLAQLANSLVMSTAAHAFATAPPLATNSS
jgi:hypothetical protein